MSFWDSYDYFQLLKVSNRLVDDDGNVNVFASVIKGNGAGDPHKKRGVGVASLFLPRVFYAVRCFSEEATIS